MIYKYIALQKAVEHKTLSRAAETMGYTPSALSQTIAALENELGMKLLNRTKGGVALTPEGETLYPYIEAAIDAFRVSQEKVRELQDMETGSIRMGALASISAHWLPRLVQMFRELHPRIDVVIHQGDYASIQNWIKTGEVDFGFVSPDAVNGIETLVLKQGEMVAVLPEQHPLTAYAQIPLEQLASEPFILLEEGNYYEPLEAFRANGLTPDVRYTVHDDYAILRMVEDGLGVSILARLILHEDHHRVEARPLLPPVERTLAIGYRSRAGLPIASREFIALLQSQLDTLPE